MADALMLYSRKDTAFVQKTHGGSTPKVCNDVEIRAFARNYRRLSRRAGNHEDTGIAKHALRLFDALAVVDSGGLLRDVRPAAAGE